MTKQAPITGQHGSERSTTANLTRILAEVQPERVGFLSVQWWARGGPGDDRGPRGR